MARQKKTLKKSVPKKKAYDRSRRARFMRNSAFVIAVLMASSLIGASYYRKTTGHLTHGGVAPTKTAKQPRPVPTFPTHPF